MVTIYDLAKQLGVTAATVSKALNNHSDVSAKTKERVLALAKELEYTPNASAKTLTTKRSNTIGVIYEEESNRGLLHEYFSVVLENIRKELNKAHYDIILLSPYTSPNDNYALHCKRLQVDGVIVVCSPFKTSKIESLINSNTPTVVLDGNYRNTTAVLSDNYNGMQKLVQYLISMGHRKIGYIHGQKEAFVTPIRLQAFYDTLSTNHIVPNPTWIKLGAYYNLDVTYKVAKSVLTSEEKPTALILSDDYVALAVYKLCTEIGLSIPNDISLVGFDGIELSQILSPPLTTIKQDTIKLGEVCAQKLLTQIELRTLPANEIVPTSFREGTSVKKIN